MKKEGIEWFESMTVAEEIKVPVEVYKKRHQELLELTTEIVERNSIEESPVLYNTKSIHKKKCIEK